MESPGNLILDLTHCNIQHQFPIRTEAVKFKGEGNIVGFDWLDFRILPCVPIQDCNLNEAMTDAVDKNMAIKCDFKYKDSLSISQNQCKPGTEKVKYICERSSSLCTLCCTNCCKRYSKEMTNVDASSTCINVMVLKMKRTIENFHVVAFTACLCNMYTESRNRKLEKFGPMEICIKTRQRSEKKKHTTQTITIFAFDKALFMLRKEDQLKRQALIRDINLIEPYREHLPMYCINAADDEFEQSRQLSVGIKTTPWFGVTGFHLRGPRNKGKC